MVQKTKSIKVRGSHFDSIKKASLEFGVHPGNVSRRIRSGWSIEQALVLTDKPKRTAPNVRRIVSSIGTFDSIRAASLATGILERTISQRLRLGWTDDQALELAAPNLSVKKGREIRCRGQIYQSIAAFARAFNMNTIRTGKRLRSGWSPEQAVDLEPAPPRYRDHKGHPRNHFWKEITEIGQKKHISAPPGSFRLYVIFNRKNNKQYVGITTNDLDARFRGHKRQAKIGNMAHLYRAMRRWGPDNFWIELIRDDAKDFPQLQQQEIKEIKKRDSIKNGYNKAVGGAIGTSKPVTIKGKKFPSLQSAAIHYGIDPSVFNLRLNRLGWTPEEAAELKHRRFNRHKLEVDGKVFNSLRSAAVAYGLDYKLVHDRYKSKGWTYAQALGIENPPRVAKKKLSFKGKNYESIADFARHYGLKEDTVSNRLRKGSSLNDAIKPVKKKI